MTAYPKTAGWKDRTVSRENARSQQPRFRRLKQSVLNLYRSGFVGTADDAAHELALSPFSIRPRCTELVQLGLLVKVRIDRSRPGRSVWVLRLTPPDRSADDRPEGYYHTALEPAEEPPFDDGQPDEQQEWRDYDSDC